MSSKKRARTFLRVGFAHFFEHVVIYGSHRDAAITKRHGGRGKYLGTVIGLIPTDPSRVLFEYHTHTEAYKKRQAKRKFFRKHGISLKERRPISIIMNGKVVKVFPQKNLDRFIIGEK